MEEDKEYPSVEEVTRDIFLHCDLENKGFADIGVLINYIEPFFYENVSELIDLKRMLDPEGKNPPVSHEVFLKVFSEWSSRYQNRNSEQSESTSLIARMSDKTKGRNVPFFHSTPRSSVAQQSVKKHVESDDMNLSDVSLYSNATGTSAAYFHERISELEHRNNKLNEELNLVKLQLLSTEENLDAFQIDNDKLRHKYSQEQNINEELRRQIKEYEDLRESSSCTAKQFTDLQKLVNFIEKENVQLKQKVPNLESEKQELEHKLEESSKKEVLARKELTEVRLELTIREEEILSIEDITSQLKNTLKEQNEEIIHLTEVTEVLKMQKTMLEKLLRDRLTKNESFLKHLKPTSYSYSEPSSVLATPDKRGSPIKRQNTSLQSYLDSSSEDDLYLKLQMISTSQSSLPSESLQAEISQAENSNKMKQHSDESLLCIEDKHKILNLQFELVQHQNCQFVIKKYKEDVDCLRQLNSEYQLNIQSLTNENNELSILLSVNKDKENILHKLNFDLEDKLNEARTSINNMKIKLSELNLVQDKCHTMEQKISKLEEDNSSKYMKIVDLLKELEQGKTSNIRQNERNDELNTILLVKNKEVHDLNTQCLSLEQQRDKLREELEETNVIADNTLEEMRNLKNQTFMLKNNLETSRNKENNLMEQIDKITSEKQMLKYENEKLNENICIFKEESNKRDCKVQHLLSEYNDLKQEIKNSEAIIADKDTEYDMKRLKLESELAQIILDYDQLQSIYNQKQVAYKDKIDALKIEIGRKDNEIVHLRMTMESLRSTILKQEELNKNFISDVKNSKSEIKVLQDKINDIKENIKRKETEIEELSNKIYCKKDTVEKLNEEIKILKNDRTKFECEIKDLREQLDDNVKEKLNLNSQLQSEKEKQVSHRGEIEVLITENKKIKDMNNNLLRVNKEVQEQLIVFKLKNSKLSAEVTETTNEIKKLNIQLQQTVQEKEQLNEQCRTTAKENEVLKNNISEVIQENNKIKKEIYNMENEFHDIKQECLQTNDQNSEIKLDRQALLKQINDLKQSNNKINTNIAQIKEEKEQLQQELITLEEEKREWLKIKKEKQSVVDEFGKKLLSVTLELDTIEQYQITQEQNNLQHLKELALAQDQISNFESLNDMLFSQKEDFEKTIELLQSNMDELQLKYDKLKREEGKWIEERNNWIEIKKELTDKIASGLASSARLHQQLLKSGIEDETSSLALECSKPNCNEMKMEIQRLKSHIQELQCKQEEKLRKSGFDKLQVQIRKLQDRNNDLNDRLLIKTKNLEMLEFNMSKECIEKNEIVKSHQENYLKLQAEYQEFLNIVNNEREVFLREKTDLELKNTTLIKENVNLGKKLEEVEFKMLSLRKSLTDCECKLVESKREELKDADRQDSVEGIKNKLSMTEGELAVIKLKLTESTRSLDSLKTYAETVSETVKENRHQLKRSIFTLLNYWREPLEKSHKEVLSIFDEEPCTVSKKFSNPLDEELFKLDHHVNLTVVLLEFLTNIQDLVKSKIDVGIQVSLEETYPIIAQRQLKKLTVSTVQVRPPSPDSPCVDFGTYPLISYNSSGGNEMQQLVNINKNNDGAPLDGQLSSFAEYLENMEVWQNQCIYNDVLISEPFPTISDSLLNNLGLDSDDTRSKISDEEMEHAFTELVLAFTIDASTVRDRCRHQSIQWTNMESNLAQRINKLIMMLNRFQQFCQNSELTLGINTIASHVTMVTDACSQVSGSAILYGGLQYEQRFMKMFNLMINYVAHLKQKLDLTEALSKTTSLTVNNSKCEQQCSKYEHTEQSIFHNTPDSFNCSNVSIASVNQNTQTEDDGKIRTRSPSSTREYNKILQKIKRKYWSWREYGTLHKLVWFGMLLCFLFGFINLFKNETCTEHSWCWKSWTDIFEPFIKLEYRNGPPPT